MLESRLSFYSPECDSEVAQLRFPPHTSLLAMGQREGMRFFPITFLQMENTLPAVPGALWSRAGGLLMFPCSLQP